MFKRNSLIGFTMKAITAIVGLALVWAFIAPYYNRILIIAADWLVTSYSLVSEAGDIYFYSPVGEPVTGIHGAALHFSVILLLALLIATPGLRIINRLRNIGFGLVTVFAFHLVILLLLAGLMQSGSGTARPSFSLPIVLLSTIGLNLVPLLVWIGLCIRRSPGSEFKKRNAAPDTLQIVK